MMVRAFHALIVLAALSLAACAVILFGPLGVAAGGAAVGLLAYPFWDRERARMREEIEKKYRGHAYASAQALGTRGRELALEFAGLTERMSRALGEEAARMREAQAQPAIENARTRARFHVIDADAAD